MQSEIIYDEVFDAQQHYRLILDSMSRPGKINVIPQVDIQQPEEINNASALVAFTLLNTDVTFCVEGDEEVAQFITLHTSAGITNLQTADFVFTPGFHSSEFIAQLKTGTLPYPEDSATIVADVTEVSYEKIYNSLEVTLRGPGIKETETVYIVGLNPDILDDVKEQNLEFPLGIDLILTDSQNRMICIPRSTDFTYIPVGGSTNNL